MQDIAIESNGAGNGGGRKIDIIVASVAIVLVGAGGVWFLLGSSDVPTLDDVATPAALTEPVVDRPELAVTATEGESVETLANKARMALGADMLAEPPGQNALYYYSLAVEADPDNAELRAELDAVADEVAALVRRYMAAGNWAAAAQLASRLALAVPGAPVLAEFENGVDNRRQALLDQAVAEAGAGRTRSANALLDEARALPGSAAASIRQTQTRLAEIADERRAAAARAAARAAQAQAAAAARTAPQDPAPVADTPVEAEPAADESPETVAEAAAEPEPEPAPATPADVTLANAIRAKVTSGSLNGDDGAITALTNAFASYPDSEALASSAELLFAAIESKVQRQLAGEDTRGAARTIRSVEKLPGAATVLTDLKRSLADAERRVAGATVIPASQLELVEAVSPVYPRSARRRELEGWVDIEFTVTRDGSTSDIVVAATSNGTTFNRATIQAVSQWRFKPRMFRGEPIDQRATTRVGFRME